MYTLHRDRPRTRRTPSFLGILFVAFSSCGDNTDALSEVPPDAAPARDAQVRRDSGPQPDASFAADATAPQDAEPRVDAADAGVCRVERTSCASTPLASECGASCCGDYACHAERCLPHCGLDLGTLDPEPAAGEVRGVGCESADANHFVLRSAECEELIWYGAHSLRTDEVGEFEVTIVRASVGLQGLVAEPEELARFTWDSGSEDPMLRRLGVFIMDVNPSETHLAMRFTAPSVELDQPLFMVDLDTGEAEVVDDQRYSVARFLDDDVMLLRDDSGDLRGWEYAGAAPPVVLARDAGSTGSIDLVPSASLVLIGAIPRVGGRASGLVVVPEADVRSALRGEREPLDLSDGTWPIFGDTRLAGTFHVVHGRYLFDADLGLTRRRIRTFEVSGSTLNLGEPVDFFVGDAWDAQVRRVFSAPNGYVATASFQHIAILEPTLVP